MTTEEETTKEQLEEIRRRCGQRDKNTDGESYIDRSREHS